MLKKMFSKSQNGFTLIEIIGVIAIMSIIVAAVTPSVISTLAAAREDAEEANLRVIAEGLNAYILENRIIPASGYGPGINTWEDNIATQTEIPSSGIATVNTTNGCDRRYWFDPATTLPAMPYNQNTVAYASLPAIAPTGVRAMFISDISASCSNSINTPAGSANFNAAWDQTGVLTESFTLKIYRLNLSQIFEPVTLVNNTATQNARTNFTDSTVSHTILDTTANAVVTDVYMNGSFTDIAGIAVTDSIDIGTSGALDRFLAGGITPVNDLLPDTFNSGTLVSTNVIATLTGGVNDLRGYVDATATYGETVSWQLFGQAASTTIASSANTTIYIINGTELQLYDAVTPTPNLLLSSYVKEAESFTYSPGPPAIWGSN